MIDRVVETVKEGAAAVGIGGGSTSNAGVGTRADEGYSAGTGTRTDNDGGSSGNQS